jgi:transcriptional regulator with XRE-family HTH domain
MARIPERGLGAAALYAWRTKHGLTATAAAAKIGVSRVSYSAWEDAGWFDGGYVPEAYHRTRIQVATENAVPVGLFEQDDTRRRTARAVAPGAA